MLLHSCCLMADYVLLRYLPSLVTKRLLLHKKGCDFSLILKQIAKNRFKQEHFDVFSITRFSGTILKKIYSFF